jgi:arginyl-tRNA synthetase
MHVGHCRGAVVGDALAGLMAYSGYQVDQGILHQRCRVADRRMLAKSRVYLRYREALGRGHRRNPGRPLSGRLSRPIGQKLADSFGTSLLGDDEAERMPLVKDEDRRRDDGHDPGRSQGAQCRSRRLFLRAQPAYA